MKNQLSESERQDLGQLEAVVAAGVRSFIEVGNALLEISDRRLYRETHGSFEPYCQEKWGMSARHAYRLCEAAKTVQGLTNWSQITNEAQCRELAKVAPEEREQVLEMAGDKPTARSIGEAADLVRGRAVAAHVAHNHEVAGAIPAPATNSPSANGVVAQPREAAEVKPFAANHHATGEAVPLRELSALEIQAIDALEVAIENDRYLIEQIKRGRFDLGELGEFKLHHQVITKILNGLKTQVRATHTH